MTETTLNNSKNIQIASYLLMTGVIIIALIYHLLWAIIPGMMVYAITRNVEQTLLAHKAWTRRAKAVSVFLVIAIVSLLLLGISLEIAELINQHQGFSLIMVNLAKLLDSLQLVIKDIAPNGISQLNSTASELLKQNSTQLSMIGFRGVRSGIIAIAGLIIGAIVAWSPPEPKKLTKPLSISISQRLQRLENAFETVFFAQVKISAINTCLTALYLMVILPIFGLHLPFTKTLILMTFVVGMLPVIGNLISNSAIIIVSSTISLNLIVASFCFLIFIHKLEYFINAKIIGSRINARTWELLIAMIFMEAIFGIEGLLAAPVLYAYLKNELSASNMIDN